MKLAFSINGKEYVALGWQSQSQLYYAEVRYAGNEPEAYLEEPKIMMFREFIEQLSKGTLIISDTLPVL